MKIVQQNVEVKLEITITEGGDFAALAQIMNDACGKYTGTDPEYRVAQQFMSYLSEEGWYRGA